MSLDFFFDSLDRAANGFARLRGWRRAGAAFAAGSLCCLGLAPIGFFPALWVGFPALVWLLGGTQKKRQAFAAGWCFAFGYFLFGLYWIAAAMFVDLARFGWMVPFTVAGLPAVLACYYGLAAAAWQWLRHRFAREENRLWDAVLLAWLFALTEYVRGFLFTGFPWNLFGSVWMGFLPVAQAASLLGLYGLTFLTLVAACLPAALAAAGRRRFALAANLAALGVFAALGLWGGARMQAPPAFLAEPYVRLVQPNIAQNMKWDSANRARNFDMLLELSAEPAARPVTHVIWPETAAAYFLEDDLPHRLQIAAALPEHAILLTGAPRQAIAANGERRFFNSLLAIDKSAAVIAAYDKFHLVPFGEYVPFRQFGPIAAAAAGLGEFFAGTGPRSLRVPGLPVSSPLICYEIIFPHEVSDHDDRPQLLINVTNDAWYGRTSGPYQHLDAARMRAIEEGTPILRAANTGISAVIDPYGRVIQQLALEEKGRIDTQLPLALEKATPYSHYGNLILIVLWLVTGVGICLSPFKNRQGRVPKS
ncbi:MAG: apolipoprotein N-acyltransferase [Alphaproteobacteria bacterium]